MFISFTNALDNDKEIYLNPDYIISVVEVKTNDGNTGSIIYVYPHNGTDYYIVREDPLIVWDKVKNNEFYCYKHILSHEIQNLTSAVMRVGDKISTLHNQKE